jgi:hypothetical protein
MQRVAVEHHCADCAMGLSVNRVNDWKIPDYLNYPKLFFKRVTRGFFLF